MENARLSQHSALCAQYLVDAAHYVQFLCPDLGNEILKIGPKRIGLLSRCEVATLRKTGMST